MRRKQNKLTIQKLNDEQRNLIGDNKLLVAKFVHKYFPKENYNNKQDLISDGITILCERINTFKPELGKYSTWVFAVLGFCLRNVHNKNRYDESTFFLKVSDSESDGNKDLAFAKSDLNDSFKPYNLSEMEQNIENEYLHENIKRLEETEQTILLMYFNDFTVEEIGAKVGIDNIFNVYYKKDKALKKLRKMIVN